VVHLVTVKVIHMQSVQELFKHESANTPHFSLISIL
jgi:hypothetical protein